MMDEDSDLSEIPSSQKRAPLKPLSDYVDDSATRNGSIARAFQSGGYTMKAIADYFGLHYSSVSKIIQAHRNS